MPRSRKMLGGSEMGTLAGSFSPNASTSGQISAMNAMKQMGGELIPGNVNGVNIDPPAAMKQIGGTYQMIVPAALVLANNVIGKGKSLRYKGKGAYRRKSSRFSRRRRGTRRR